MKHAQLLLVPALMLADYLLTIWAAKMRAAAYRSPPSASYELNPVWRRSVDAGRWFNPRHLLAVVVVTAALVMVDQLDEPAHRLFKFFLGMLLGSFCAVVGRHIANLLTFREMVRNPESMIGQVEISPQFGLRVSQFNLIGSLPLLLIIAVLVPNPYTFGVVFGIVVQILAHFVWGLRAMPRLETVPRPDDSPPTSEVAS